MSVKIISWKIENGMLKVKTNNPHRPNFVYFANKFTTKEALLKEINKSLDIETKKKDKKEKKIKNLENELNA